MPTPREQTRAGGRDSCGADDTDYSAVLKRSMQAIKLYGETGQSLAALGRAAVRAMQLSCREPSFEIDEGRL